jgi:hypothetical protein
MINALPVLTLFPLIGLEVIHFLGRFSTESLKLSPKKAHIALLIALGTVFVFYIARTSWATFREWPKSEEVKFVWQEAFTGIAAYLDDNPSLHSAAIGGWTPESMDPPSMELALKREDVQIRYFDPIRGLILPLGGEAAENGVIARPTLLPMDSYLEEKLIAWGTEPEVIDSFTLYHLKSGISIHPEKETETSFDNELLFLGYDALTPCEDLGEVASCELVSFWRVLETVKESRRIFLHVVDENGRIVDQDDGLAAPSEHWRAGDVILQRHSLEQTASDSVLRIGVYDPETAIRLITSHGAEFVEFRLEDGFG